jgi:phage terminase small subunit
MKNITARHRRFVEAYCEHFNGARAAREAGYAEKTAAQQASRLLADPDISQMVEDRLDDLAMSSAEATKRLGDMARSDITEFFEVATIQTDDGEREVMVLDRETFLEKAGSVVQEITWDQNGRPKLKLYDKKDALKTILEAHGAFNHTQEHELSGPDGGPIQWGPAPSDTEGDTEKGPPDE